MPERTPFDDLDPELLDRYLAGECSEEETAQVRRWLMARPEAASRLEAFLGRIDGGDRAPVPGVASSWQELHARMRASDTSTPLIRARPRATQTRPLGTSRLPRRWIARAAAACALSSRARRTGLARAPPVAERPSAILTAARERSG